MRQAYECRTQQKIVLMKHVDIFYIMPSGSPAIVNRRTSNKYLFIKIRSWNELITQRLCMTCVNMSSSTDDSTK